MKVIILFLNHNSRWLVITQIHKSGNKIDITNSPIIRKIFKNNHLDWKNSALTINFTILWHYITMVTIIELEWKLNWRQVCNTGNTWHECSIQILLRVRSERESAMTSLKFWCHWESDALYARHAGSRHK